VTEAIQQGTAYDITNGSYKDNLDISAFLLKGNSGEYNHIMGGIKISGNLAEQFLYQAKLGGIEGIIATVDCADKVHNITKRGLDRE
jgi:hypothetical protein